MHTVVGTHHNLKKGAGGSASRHRWLSPVVAAIVVPIIALATTFAAPPRPVAQLRTVVRGDDAPTMPTPPTVEPETAAPTLDGFLIDAAVRLSLALIALLVLLRFATWLQVALRWLAGGTVIGLIVVIAALILVHVG